MTDTEVVQVDNHRIVVKTASGANNKKQSDTNLKDNCIKRSNSLTGKKWRLPIVTLLVAVVIAVCQVLDFSGTVSATSPLSGHAFLGENYSIRVIFKSTKLTRPVIVNIVTTNLVKSLSSI